MLVLRAIAFIWSLIPGLMRIMRGRLVTIVASGSLYLIGAKPNRTGCQAYRAVEYGYRKDGDDDSGRIGFCSHFYSQAITVI